MMLGCLSWATNSISRSNRFLADGDAMTLSFRRLRGILESIERRLPGVHRVASYCLPRNLHNKTVEELAELEDMKRGLEENTVNPMDLKKKLANELVTQFHGKEAANKAADIFVTTVQRHELPDDIPTFDLPDQAALSGMKLSGLLVASGLAASNGEARRLIGQGAVQIDGERVAEDASVAGMRSGSVLRSGRRRYVRLV